MSKSPPIPKSQQPRHGGGKVDVSGDSGDRRDRRTDAPDGQPGDAGVNRSEQGRFGNIAQNLTHQGRQQDR